MNDAQRTRARSDRQAAGGFGALAAGVALILVLGGCVGAAPSGPASVASGTGAPPVAVTPGSPSAAVPSAVETPATPQATATPPLSRTPKPAAAAAPTRATTPTPKPTPEPKPTPATTAGSLVVTQVDNGATLRLVVGQEFLLDLGSSLDWAATVADLDVVSRVIGVLVVQGAQGIYEARAPGTTVLSAIGSPNCSSGICPLYRVAFKVTITVN